MPSVFLPAVSDINTTLRGPTARSAWWPRIRAYEQEKAIYRERKQLRMCTSAAALDTAIY